MNRINKRIHIDKMSLSVIILANYFLTFFEEILELHIIILALYTFALGLMLFKEKIKIMQGSLVMLLYAAGVVISVIANDTSFRALYRAALCVIIILYAVISSPEIDTIDFVKHALLVFGLINAAAVLVQFLLKEQFTDVFYDLLIEGGRKDALFYYKRGYYAGINVKPHETAGMISIAMATLFTRKWEGKLRWWLLLPLALFVPLLLTGKRAITGLVVVGVFLLYILSELANRRWKRVLTIIGAAAVFGVVAIFVIKANVDKPLFARFATLFDGSVIDKTRLSLWKDAWILFKENPLFGVGRSNFNTLTVERFHYYRSHSVNLDYLQWLCEGGIVGFSLMLTPVIYVLVRAIKLGCHAAKENVSSREKSLIFLAVYIQFFILLYAFVEVPFYSVLFFGYYIFSCIIVNTLYPKYCGARQKMKEREIDLVELKGKLPRNKKEFKLFLSRAFRLTKRLLASAIRALKNRIQLVYAYCKQFMLSFNKK